MNRSGDVVIRTYDISIYFVATVGILLNICVVVLSIRLESLRNKDYSYLVCNHAAIGLVGSLLLIFQQVIRENSESVCAVWGFLTLWWSSSFIQGPIPVIFLRYIGVCRSALYANYFSKPVSIFLCGLYPHVMSLGMTVATTRWYQFGQEDSGTTCSLKTKSSVYQTGAAFTFLSVISIGSFCSFKLLREIKKMERAQQSLQLHDKIEETRFLIRSVLIQALAPLLIQTPAIAFVSAIDSQSFTSRLFRMFSYLLFNFGYVADPIVTLIVIKPYRTAVLQFLRKLPSNRTAKVSEAPYIQQTPPFPQYRF